MKIYEEPILEISTLNSSDVITTSTEDWESEWD